MSPVIKQTFDNPIDGQNIFHQTEVEQDELMNKVKIDTYLTSVLEGNQNAETVSSLQNFMQA
jgi:hypothetical protein